MKQNHRNISLWYFRTFRTRNSNYYQEKRKELKMIKRQNGIDFSLETLEAKQQ